MKGPADVPGPWIQCRSIAPLSGGTEKVMTGYINRYLVDLHLVPKQWTAYRQHTRAACIEDEIIRDSTHP
jgi:hypothetical protein